MIRIYCPVCNGLVKLADNKTEAYCVSCGRKIRVPAGYSPLESRYLFAAEKMQLRDFAAAKATYGEIITDNPDQAEAYFKRALADYEIEYQKTADGSYRMVCHQAEKADFLTSGDVKQALLLAADEKKEEYLEQATRVEALQKAVSAYAAGHPPVDVWLEADRGNLFSLDKTIQIRQMIESIGLSVFCPALDLEEDESDRWECAFYRAASTAKAMVIVAVGADSFPDEVNFNVLRFLYLKEKAQREAKNRIPALFLAYDGLDEYEDIPDSWFDGLDERFYMGEEDFAARLRDVLCGISVNYGASLHGNESGREDFSYTNRLLRARQTLESGDFENASMQYEDILLNNPTESQAFWGLLLSSRGCASEQALIESGLDITGETDYRNALAFANERQQQTYREVAAQVEEMAGVYAAQKEAARRQEKLREKERREKEKEVQKDQEKKRRREMKTRAGWKRILLVMILLVIVGAAGAAFGYRFWKQSDAGVTYTKYQEAVKAFRSSSEDSDFYSTYELFNELGDYKESESMAAQALTRYYQLRYNNAVSYSNTLTKRPLAVSYLLDCAEYMEEAQELLDELYAEGIAFWEEGDYYSAWMTLEGFGKEDENFLKVWRKVFSMGLMDGGGNGAILGITEDGTLTYSSALEGFGIEEGTAISVSVSDSGESLGIVRGDGTAYLLGTVKDNANQAVVLTWSDLICIKVNDKCAAGLTSDGRLYRDDLGLVAENIIQFDMNEDGWMIAVRSDGTLYCNEASVNLSGGCAEYSFVFATVADSTIFAVTEEGTLYNVTKDVLTSTKNVAVVYSGCGRAGWLKTNDSQYYYDVAGKKDYSVNGYNIYFGAFAAYGDVTTNLLANSSGTVTGIVYGTDSDSIALKNAVKEVDGVGVPCLE